MSIPDNLIEEVRRRADLTEMVAEHTRLKRSGKTFRGPCPLHGGEGPNFSVDPGKNIFKCFVCGEAGDVFSFPMKQFGMSFLEAVRWVADRVGVEIPDAREERREVDPLERHYETNGFAADWFRKQLWNTEGGAGAREYLKARGVSTEAAERFGLGWAPSEWTALGDAARKHGIPNDLLLSLGLVKESTKGGREPYDAFRGRLIFPIEDLGGRIVAFGGRVIEPVEDHIPKYLNSAETPVYHKGDVLYGLGWSRGAIRRSEEALVVEGYMDYVALAANGVENVVAPLGTAMTTRQAELLARYGERVILLYDSDAAGLKATFRSGDELLRAGVEVLVATLPEGEDPDSLVRSRGADALRRYLSDAVDVMERKIQILERRDYFSSISGVRKAIDALLPSVRAAADEVLRGVYIARISERTGVPRETIEREVAEAPARDFRPAGGADRRRVPQGRRAADFGAPAATANLGPERNLVLLLLRDENWVEQAAQKISPEDFRDPVYRAIYLALLELHAEGGRDAGAEWLQSLPDEILPRVQDLIGDPEASNLSSPDQIFGASLQRLIARPYEERLAEIQRELEIAPPEQQMALQLEQHEVRTTMREMHLMGSRKHGMLRQFPGER
ncbi:MAG: DNA primase [Gemmatimonadetes bacterium]|nr:DNA primase [Gemmatimonadota bacterium]